MPEVPRPPPPGLLGRPAKDRGACRNGCRRLSLSLPPSLRYESATSKDPQSLLQGSHRGAAAPFSPGRPRRWTHAGARGFVQEECSRCSIVYAACRTVTHIVPHITTSHCSPAPPDVCGARSTCGAGFVFVAVFGRRGLAASRSAKAYISLSIYIYIYTYTHTHTCITEAPRSQFSSSSAA